VYVSGNVTGIPTAGVAGEAVPTVIVEAALTLIVTDAVGAAVAVEPDPVEAVDTPAVAVTLAVRFVVIVVVAVPVTSVVATDALSVPLSVVKVTGTPGNKFPPESKTLAVTVDVPPLAATVPGDALIPMVADAAAPMAILIALVPLAETPPERAVIVAVPELLPATNLTTTRPEMSVSASDGWMVPRFVVNVTTVPLCGGVPPASITCAMMSVVPFDGSADASAVSVMVDPLGASRRHASHCLDADLHQHALDRYVDTVH
jgi:hypothetical protein